MSKNKKKEKRKKRNDIISKSSDPIGYELATNALKRIKALSKKDYGVQETTQNASYIESKSNIAQERNLSLTNKTESGFQKTQDYDLPRLLTENFLKDHEMRTGSKIGEIKDYIKDETNGVKLFVFKTIIAILIALVLGFAAWNNFLNTNIDNKISKCEEKIDKIRETIYNSGTVENGEINKKKLDTTQKK